MAAASASLRERLGSTGSSCEVRGYMRGCMAPWGLDGQRSCYDIGGLEQAELMYLGDVRGAGGAGTLARFCR